MGLALVKMRSHASATLLLEKHGIMEIENVPVWLEYGFEPSPDDWRCSKCDGKNQARRSKCFLCGGPSTQLNMNWII